MELDDPVSVILYEFEKLKLLLNPVSFFGSYLYNRWMILTDTDYVYENVIFPH